MTSPFDVLPVISPNNEHRNVVMTHSMYAQLVAERNEARLKYDEAVREYLNARAELDVVKAEAAASAKEVDKLKEEINALLSADSYVDAAADARAIWATRKSP